MTERRDPTLPTKITYEVLEDPHGHVCTQGRCKEGLCGRKAKWDIRWQHLHRGVIKRARRKRCQKHGSQFFRRHGVKVSGSR